MSIDDIRRTWVPPLDPAMWPVVVQCMIGLGGHGWDGQTWRPVSAATDVGSIRGVVWPVGDLAWAAAVPLIWASGMDNYAARERVAVWLLPEETQQEMGARIRSEVDAEIAGHLEGHPLEETQGTGAHLRSGPGEGNNGGEA